MDKLKKNLNLIFCIIIMVILTILMFFYIDKKEGFHEDEIFSYTASNSKYSNVLLTYSKIDNMDTVLKGSNIWESLKNFVHYRILNTDEYDEKIQELSEERNVSIWRTREDAIESMEIDTFSESLDFFTVYWNTAKDVHPPLFYFLVHIVSCLFFGHFSKYIIFIINLCFFLGTCFLVMKIMKKIDREYLSAPLLIFYGFSIGAISAVMFQRMYMMLTFFTVYFLYTNLKIYYNDFKLDKKLKIELCVIIILGFLTQYYFCIYAAMLAIVMIVLMLIKKLPKKDIFCYIMQFVKSAIIGIILFVPSIYHIFFSYRSPGGRGSDFTFLEKLIKFIQNIFTAFSLPDIIGIIIFVILTILIIIECKNSENRKLFSLLIFPVVFNFIAVCMISPYRSLRYIMNILPIISIIIIIAIDNILKNKKISVGILTFLACLISVYGLLTNDVKYLYIGYNEYLEVAENYSDDRFVLICPTEFNHIADIPEMKIYKESIIIAPDKLEELKVNNELQEDGEFILSIKKWAGDTDEFLEEVLKNTGFSKYELLLESNNSVNCEVYLLKKD